MASNRAQFKLSQKNFDLLKKLFAGLKIAKENQGLPDDELIANHGTLGLQMIEDRSNIKADELCQVLERRESKHDQRLSPAEFTFLSYHFFRANDLKKAQLYCDKATASLPQESQSQEGMSLVTTTVQCLRGNIQASILASARETDSSTPAVDFYYNAADQNDSVALLELGKLKIKEAKIAARALDSEEDPESLTIEAQERFNQSASLGNVSAIAAAADSYTQSEYYKEGKTTLSRPLAFEFLYVSPALLRKAIEEKVVNPELIESIGNVFLQCFISGDESRSAPPDALLDQLGVVGYHAAMLCADDSAWPYIEKAHALVNPALAERLYRPDQIIPLKKELFLNRLSGLVLELAKSDPLTLTELIITDIQLGADYLQTRNKINYLLSQDPIVREQIMGRVDSYYHDVYQAYQQLQAASTLPADVANIVEYYKSSSLDGERDLKIAKGLEESREQINEAFSPKIVALVDAYDATFKSANVMQEAKVAAIQRLSTHIQKIAVHGVPFSGGKISQDKKYIQELCKSIGQEIRECKNSNYGNFQICLTKCQQYVTEFNTNLGKMGSISEDRFFIKHGITDTLTAEIAYIIKQMSPLLSLNSGVSASAGSSVAATSTTTPDATISQMASAGASKMSTVGTIAAMAAASSITPKTTAPLPTPTPPLRSYGVPVHALGTRSKTMNSTKNSTNPAGLYATPATSPSMKNHWLEDLQKELLFLKKYGNDRAGIPWGQSAKRKKAALQLYNDMNQEIKNLNLSGTASDTKPLKDCITKCLALVKAQATIASKSEKFNGSVERLNDILIKSPGFSPSATKGITRPRPGGTGRDG